MAWHEHQQWLYLPPRRCYTRQCHTIWIIAQGQQPKNELAFKRDLCRCLIIIYFIVYDKVGTTYYMGIPMYDLHTFFIMTCIMTCIISCIISCIITLRLLVAANYIEKSISVDNAYFQFSCFLCFLAALFPFDNKIGRFAYASWRLLCTQINRKLLRLWS